MRTDELITNNKKEWKQLKRQGVYLVYKNTEVIYIGQSKNLNKRIKRFRKEYFDYIGFLFTYNDEARKGLEKKLISKYRPKDNFIYNYDKYRKGKRINFICNDEMEEKIEKYIEKYNNTHEDKTTQQSVIEIALKHYFNSLTNTDKMCDDLYKEQCKS
jgi:excinuclease UvrABC nuclease subunit